LDRLGQAKPNDIIKFSEVTLKEAHERLLEYQRMLSGLAGKLIRVSLNL